MAYAACVVKQWNCVRYFFPSEAVAEIFSVTASFSNSPLAKIFFNLQMQSYVVSRTVEQHAHCFLRTPYSFVLVVHFYTLFLTFYLKDQELCRTISYFSTYCHSFNIVCNIEELFRDDLKNRMIPIQRYIYFCKYANLSPLLLRENGNPKFRSTLV